MWSIKIPFLSVLLKTPTCAHFLSVRLTAITRGQSPCLGQQQVLAVSPDHYLLESTLFPLIL